MGSKRTDPPTWADKHRRARNNHTTSRDISAPRINSRATPSNLGSRNRKAFMAIHTEGGTSISSRFRTVTSTTA